MAAAVAVLATGGCGSGDTGTAADGSTKKTTESKAAPAALTDDQYLENAADFVDTADWDAAETVKIQLGEMFFKPKNLSLEAGKPYVLELVNIGKVKHEFTASKFFRSAATRKIESTSSEVKMPFFTEVEVLPGMTANFFVIPVVTGAFETLCEIEGHREAGMEGTITVTGTTPTVPAPVLGSLKAGAWLQDGPALVEAASETWDATAKTVRVEAGEHGAKMFFEPKDVSLKVGTPYVLELVNIGRVKHEFTAAEFFPTVALRKVQDAQGEYKGLLLNEVEVLTGMQTDLYVIPTKAGSFEIVCEIPGHREAGMFGTIKVVK